MSGFTPTLVRHCHGTGTVRGERREVMPMSRETYSAQRRQTVKATMKRLRRESGYSKEAVARALGCARSRIAAIEDQESPAEYTLEEIEILAALCGKHPLEVLRLRGPELLHLSAIVSATVTGSALLAS